MGKKRDAKPEKVSERDQAGCRGLPRLPGEALAKTGPRGNHGAPVTTPPGSELDRGGPYIELSEITPMDCPFVTPEQSASRRAITEVFDEFGFAAYPYEFWHYSRGDLQEAALHRTGQPARYGPVSFDPADGKVTPVPDALEPFVPLDEIRRKIADALAGA